MRGSKSPAATLSRPTPRWGQLKNSYPKSPDVLDALAEVFDAMKTETLPRTRCVPTRPRFEIAPCGEGRT